MVKFSDQLTDEEKEQAAKEIEESLSCEVCGHWVSMHGDNGECYSCPKNQCIALN